MALPRILRSTVAVLLLALAASSFGQKTKLSSRVTGESSAPAHQVTWNYLRMHHPEVVVQMLRDVQSGKLPRSAVEGLGDAKTVDSLLKSKYPETNSSPSGTKMMAMRTAPASSWANIAKGGFGMIVSHQPNSLDFGDVKSGDKATMNLALTSPTDGKISASLSGNSKFHVDSIRLLSGEISSGSEGTSGGTTAKAGQSIRVRVSLSDSSKLKVGKYTSNLTVKGSGWNLVVPVSANVVAPGHVSFEVDEYEHWTVPGKDFDVSVILKNRGPATKVAFTPKTLPSRVFLNPTTFQLGANATQYEKLHFHVASGISEGENQSIRIDAKAFNGDQASTVATSVSVYDPTTIAETTSTIKGSDGTTFSIHWYASVHNDGRYHWIGSVTPGKKDVLITSCSSTMYVPTTTVSIDDSKTPKDGTPFLYCGHDGTSSQFRDSYGKVGQESVHFKISLTFNHNF